MAEKRLIVYIKEPDTYIYRYDDQSRPLLVDLLSKQAANPKLNLSWYDAALIIRTAKQKSTNRFGSPSDPL